MKKSYYIQGFTLMELMITVAIIGLLASIAIPSYNEYITTSQTATAKSNAVTLAGFMDTYFYENETYLEGSYIPGGTNDFAALEWNPAGDNIFKYAVTAGACGDIKECYSLTVTLVSDPSISQTITKP